MITTLIKKNTGNILKQTIFYIFFFGIVYFFGQTLFSNFQDIKNYNFHINFFYLFLSLISFLIFFWSLGVLWGNLLFSNKSNSPPSQPSPLTPLPSGERGITQISNKQIHYINAISWISKYIPGKVAMIATKVYYLEKKGIPKKISFLSCIYEHIFQIISSFALSIPFIIYYFWGTQHTLYITLSALSLIIGLFFIHPYIFNATLNFLLRILKKSTLKKNQFLSGTKIIRYIIGYSLSMIIKGVSFVFLVASITQVSGLQEIVFYSFAWIFSGVVGILAIFAPNGLGVREGVLTLVLSLVLPLEIAILISVISRLWFSICDGLIGGWILGVKWRT